MYSWIVSKLDVDKSIVKWFRNKNKLLLTSLDIVQRDATIQNAYGIFPHIAWDSHTVDIQNRMRNDYTNLKYFLSRRLHSSLVSDVKGSLYQEIELWWMCWNS
jgi:hypothetical protein